MCAFVICVWSNSSAWTVHVFAFACKLVEQTHRWRRWLSGSCWCPAYSWLHRWKWCWQHRPPSSPSACCPPPWLFQAMNQTLWTERNFFSGLLHHKKWWRERRKEGKIFLKICKKCWHVNSSSGLHRGRLINMLLDLIENKNCHHLCMKMMYRE